MIFNKSRNRDSTVSLNGSIKATFKIEFYNSLKINVIFRFQSYGMIVHLNPFYLVVDSSPFRKMSFKKTSINLL